MFQDIHAMIFIGFGFLNVFLKMHSWTSVGYNLLISAYSIQLVILSAGFWHQFFKEEYKDWKKIPLDIPCLIKGDYGAASVVIAFGAILGKCSLL